MITRGKIKFSNGIYIGLIENGYPTLAGRFDFNDGRSYIGEFKYNEVTGYGLMMYPNGTFYLGYFNNTLKNGRFIVVNKTSISNFPSSFFVGDYKNDYKNGQGYEITKHEVISSNYSNDVGYGSATSFGPYYGYKYREYNNGVLNYGEKVNVYKFYWDYNFQVEVYGSPTSKIAQAKAVSVNLYDHYAGKFSCIENNQIGLDEFTCEGYKLNNKDDLRPVFTTGTFRHRVNRTSAFGSNVYRIDKDYVYFGGFDAKPNGTGVRASIDGSYLQIGRFVNDKLYGRGLYITMAGSIEIGEFKDNKLDGNGVKYCTWTKTTYDGMFKDGSFERGYQKEASDQIMNMYESSSPYLGSNSSYNYENKNHNYNSNSYGSSNSDNKVNDSVNVNNSYNEVKSSKQSNEEGYFTRLFKTMGKLPDPIDNKPITHNKVKEKSPLEIKLSKDFIVKNGKEIKKYIGDKSIKEITILEGVTKIHKECFASLTSLSSIVLPSSLKEIDKGAFKETNLKEIDLSNTKVTSLSSDLFKYCKQLESIKLSSNITTFENEVFYGCSSLLDIDLSHVNSIGYGVFYGCSSLKKVDISSLSMNSIPNYTFASCTSLEEVVISSLIRRVSYRAFDCCNNLSSFDFTNIEEIDGYAFSSTLIKEVKLDKAYYINSFAFNCCTSLIKVEVNEIRDNLINEGAFYGCSSLKEVILPSNLTVIKKKLFENCSVLSYLDFKNVCIIEEKAFINSGIKKVSSSLIKEIHEYAFYSCKSLIELEINNIEVIKKEAFKNCISLEIVNVGDLLNELDNSSFINCTSLKEKVTCKYSIEEEIEVNPTLFYPYDCTLLKGKKDRYHIYDIKSKDDDYIYFPFGTESIGLGKPSIKNLKKVKEFYCPKTVKEICSYSLPFKNFPKIEDIDLGDSLINDLYKDLFKNCKSLKSITLPPLVNTIDEEMFINCKKLTTIIGKGIKYIKANAFKNCKNLTKVEFSSSVKLDEDSLNGIKNKEDILSQINIKK